MINDFLNQQATWYKASEKLDDYGQPSYTGSSIQVRWEHKRRLVKDKQGNEVVSECRVFCEANVQEGDQLEYNGRKWPVIVSSILYELDGSEGFREVSL